MKSRLDITFSNEQEIMSLINTSNFNEVIEFSKKIKKLIVITRGDKGALAINGDEVVECLASKNLKVVDLTGAGDLFAAGFLHGLINGKTIKESLVKGTSVLKSNSNYWSKNQINHFFFLLKLPFPFFGFITLFLYFLVKVNRKHIYFFFS